jgi:very-short-patch-repair endonuclease
MKNRRNVKNYGKSCQCCNRKDQMERFCNRCWCLLPAEPQFTDILKARAILNRLKYGPEQALKRYLPNDWTHQAVIGSYIVDFLHVPSLTIVEIDESQHQSNIDKSVKDREKESFFRSLGYSVHRFRDLMAEREGKHLADALCEHVAKR